MRSLVAFDVVRSDIIYARCDAEFKEHLEEAYGPEIPYLSQVLQFFTSVSFTQTKQCENLDNPIEGIRLRNGSNVAFHRFDNVDVMCVDSCTAEEAMARCVLFEKIAKLHLGPAIHSLRPEDPEVRARLWGRIEHYMDSWADVTGASEKYSHPDPSYFAEVYGDYFQQHFLFEAVEELHVNQMLKRQARDLLASALSAARHIDPGYCQATLMANGRVICSHSTAQAPHRRTDTLDRLLLIFLAHVSLPRSPVDIDSTDSSVDMRVMKSHQQTVFIKKKNQPEHYLPCTLTAVSIRPGIVLSLLAEVRTAVAPNICRAIQRLSVIHALAVDTINRSERDDPGREREPETAPLREEFGKCRGVVDLCVRNISKDLSGAENGDLAREWAGIRREWEGVVGRAKRLGEQLNLFERALGGVVSKLRKLFHRIYCTDTEAPVHEDVLKIYRSVSVGLRDSSSFLLVKAQRNFTLGNYLLDFPGLVHFALINRSSNRVVVPVLAGEGGESGRFCLEIQRTLHRFGRSLLLAGLPAGYMRRKELLYGYSCWFTSRDGIRLQPPTTKEQWRPRRGSREMQCLLYAQMAEHYFGGSAGAEVGVYELLTVHLGDLPFDFVAKSAERLRDVVMSDFSLGD